MCLKKNFCIILSSVSGHWCVNTLRPRQNGRHFAEDIFKCILLNENVWIPNKISLKFVPKGPINNIPSLVQIMAWCRPGDKPLSEPMMVSSLTHICVTRPQWVKKHASSCWFLMTQLRNLRKSSKQVCVTWTRHQDTILRKWCRKWVAADCGCYEAVWAFEACLRWPNG